MRWSALVLAAVLILAAGAGRAQAPPAKLALVIGVSDYGRDRAAQEAAGFAVPSALPNAVRDANAVAAALQSKGFRVSRVENPDKRAMLAAINAFAAALSGAGADAVGVFYFAGHGAQGRPALERDIDNYLIPLGADLVTEVDLESEALALSRVSETLRPATRGAMVLILDACRNFALPSSNRAALVTRGLAEAKAAPGTLIAYSTSPGSTALDGAPGAGGPYANALSAELRSAEGASLTDLFNAVRNRVLSETRETQLPWENSSLRRAVTIGVAPPAAASAGPTSRAAPLPAGQYRLDFSRGEDGAPPRHVVAAEPYLRAGQMPVSVSARTPAASVIVFQNNLGAYGGRALKPTVSENFLTQINTGLVASSFTLSFDRPMKQVTFLIPAIWGAGSSGIVFPEWSATALDAAGQELDVKGDRTRTDANPNEQRHTLAAPAGSRGIAAVRFDSNSHGFAAFETVMIEEIIVEPR